MTYKFFEFKISFGAMSTLQQPPPPPPLMSVMQILDATARKLELCSYFEFPKDSHISQLGLNYGIFFVTSLEIVEGDIFTVFLIGLSHQLSAVV